MKYFEIKVEFLKLWIALLFTAVAGISAWLYNNYGKIGSLRFLSVTIVFMVIFVTLSLITKKCYKLIKEIKNYKGEKND